jgi:hypothetical protein
MSVPLPPTIYADAQFNTMQAGFVKNDGSAVGNSSSNGYVTEKGGLTSVTGQNQTYPVAAVAKGIIIRSGLTVSTSVDTLPSATDLATELGLFQVDGASFIRSFVVYDATNYSLQMTGTGWTFPGTNYVGAYNATTFYYVISYTTLSGWAVSCLSSGVINLD